MRSALRRLALLLASMAVAVGGAGALLGLAAGSSLGRAVSLAYYVAGATLLVLGFFAGNRGPLRGRIREEDEPVATGLFGVGIALRGARRASGDEQRDTVATAGVFLGLGLWLIVLGVAADTSVALF